MTISDELKKTFELAAMRKEARDIRSPRQWAKANEVVQRARHLRWQETTRFSERYTTRVEMVEKRLIHEAGKRQRVLKPVWLGVDRFDKDSLNLQAQREVRAAHQRRLQTIDLAESRMLSKLVTESRRENALLGQARSEFTRTTNRRAGSDRRRRLDMDS